METNHHGSESTGEPELSPAGSDDSPHWLLGFLRPDVLALTAAVAAAATVFGPVVGGLAYAVFTFSPDFPSKAWTYVPLLVGCGVAVLAGVLGLYRAAASRSAGWIHALAGSAALVGLVTAIGVVVAWSLSPDRTPFEEVYPPAYGDATIEGPFTD